MAKDKQEEQAIESVVEKAKEEKVLTYCYLCSKANFNIPVKSGNSTIELPPFGKIKIAKEQLELDTQFARYLSLVKI